ncbi:MAG TPA: HupE/UreJ family protein [Polyangiaceae bacterium]|nr:HupE/UreJ family protein [Polyangiaceae bacterium]
MLLTLSTRAFAHDLAIDQVMLWPDRQTGELRGEITFDPELTRSKDAQPTDEHARQVVEFLSAHLQLTLDGRRVPLAFEVRELWVRGGATLGDVVRFRAPLAASEHELRLQGTGFEALVVSVQHVRAAASSAAGRVETTSWLLGKDDWTPVYRIDTGWQEPGWREGGPDVFIDATGTSNAASNVAPTSVGAAPASAAPASASSDDDTRTASSLGLAARFVRLGFEHILPGGVDHMLFVAGLVLASARRYRQILISLSLFTLAHTLTLALGNYQLVQVTPQVVEPLIAFSIFVVGVDNLRARRSVETPASARYAVVFSFGLVHGLGFASALSELSFGGDHLLLGLLSFNAGVELGQIAVVALLALLMHGIRQWQKAERWATLAGSAVIAASGLFMVVDRLATPSSPTSISSSPVSSSAQSSLNRSL